MEAKKIKYICFEDYLALEQSEVMKYEFHHGEIYALAGGTIAHGLICKNVLVELTMHLRTKNSKCKAINSEIKLHIPTLDKYVYPDAMVMCSDLPNPNEHAITNPTVIVEVLSKSTEAYDRGDKFHFYRQIESLQEYILIDQYQARIDVYTRKSDLWKITRIEGLSEQLHIQSLDIHLELKNIYLDIF